MPFGFEDFKPKLISGTEASFDDIYNAVSTAADTISPKMNEVVNKVTKEYDEYEARTNLSITNFIKKMMVVSRVFIQNKIADDPSLDDNLATIQNQYLAFILCALNLTDSIEDGRTIKTVMSVVSTEKYNSFKDIADSVFGLEANTNNNNRNRTYDNPNSNYDGAPLDKDAYTQQELQRIQKDDPELFQQIIDYSQNQKYWDRLNEKERQKVEQEDERRYQKTEDRRHQREAELEKKRQEESEKRKRTIENAIVDNETRNLSISSGRIIQVTIGGKKINIPVQLIPTLIPNEVAEAFVEINFTPSKAQRWFQVTAGEISFFKDFIRNMDLIKRTQDAIRKDKTGTLAEMKKRQYNAAAQAAGKMVVPEMRNKQNIANAVLVFEKQSFINTAKRNGLNWNNFQQRERFFNKTFSFMMVLIDPIYAKSEYYWSGFDMVGEFSNRQLKAAAKRDSYDLKDIMAAFAQGRSPKF